MDQEITVRIFFMVDDITLLMSLVTNKEVNKHKDKLYRF